MTASARPPASTHASSTADGATTSRSKLSIAETLLVGSLMFGLFFGAGNLIFPVALGLQAGQSVWPAAAGFLIGAVGLPILGIIASALSRTASLHELASRVSPWFGTLFTCALYLTIGPFFAGPRSATVPFEMAFGGVVDAGARPFVLGLFTFVFFAMVLAAALRPGRLMDIVGRFLTPIFLVLLAVLLVVALVQPAGVLPAPQAPYDTAPATQGILDGYNTMDALASLAFALVIIEAVRRLGLRKPGAIAAQLGKSGLVAGVAMGAIYLALALVGANAASFVASDANGAAILQAISGRMFGVPGQILAALIMLVACLKTAIGLMTACSEMFAEMFPRVLSQRGWAICFTCISFVLANVGLTAILQASVPVLEFIYPLAICIIMLGLLNRWVQHRPWPYRLMILGAALASLVALLVRLKGTAVGEAAAAVGALLPGFAIGFGWVLPAFVGLVVGMLLPARRSLRDLEQARPA